MPRRRAFGIVLLVLAATLLGGQLVAPRIAEKRVADRLERDGGQATVHVRALPWVLLLVGRGQELSVRGHGLRLPLGGGQLGRLDGFRRVAVVIERSQLGPLAVSRLEIRSVAGKPRRYLVGLRGSASPAALGGLAGEALGGPLGGAIGSVAGGLAGDTPLPFAARALLESENGRPRTIGAEGTVAGVPAGGLIELAAQALASRL